ncbi:MAG: DUF1501 domain-containing protein [Fimbriimonadaceae bacterium]
MSGCKEYQSVMSRRQFVGRGALATTAALTMPAWMPRMAFGQSGTNRDVMIAIFLEGGADGLSICVPHGDDDYYVHRNTEAIARPDSTDPNKCIDLDGFFGISPAFQPLKDIYDDEKLLFVHATGAAKTTWTRSHFDAMRWHELGKPDDISLGSGWLGRHLNTSSPSVVNAPLRGISMSYGMMDMLATAPLTLPIPYPESFGYDGWFPHRSEMLQTLQDAYNQAGDPLKAVAQNTQNTVNLLNAIDFEHYVPAGGAVYPENEDFARAMRVTAAMIRAEIGLEVVGIRVGGWDTHDNQGTNTGYLRDTLDVVAKTLKAFYSDMNGANKPNFIVAVMSEFGRKVIQNGSGTDHGYANAMMLMGGSVIGGRVMRTWPGLHLDQLHEEQDLKVTIDYRDILAEIVKKRLKNNNISQVFPNYTPTYRGTVAA